jgi:sigma-B regulation protein RsbU (phosphoserine phosphatase)
MTTAQRHAQHVGAHDDGLGNISHDAKESAGGCCPFHASGLEGVPRDWTLRQLELLEHAPDAMLASDVQGRIIFANSKTAALFGYGPDELIGQRIEALVPRELRDVHRHSRQHYAAQPHARPMGAALELWGVRKDGSRLPLDISLSPIHLDTGAAVIAAIRDLTERRAADAKLREAHRRLQRDLDAAAAIQKSLFPKTLPLVDGMRFAWAWEPSERLAGDSFNVFPVDDDHVGFYLLDVSGHGVAAALQAVALTRVLASRPWQASVLHSILSPAEVARDLNRQFPIDPDTWQYFTFICATLDVHSHELRFTSAGHPGPIYLPAEGEPVTYDAPGFPIGLFPDATYEEHQLIVRPGDRVLFHSDGATDASDAHGADFGRRRLADTWSASREIPLDAALAGVVGAIKEWSGGGDLQDDLTLLAIEPQE